MSEYVGGHVFKFLFDRGGLGSKTEAPGACEVMSARCRRMSAFVGDMDSGKMSAGLLGSVSCMVPAVAVQRKVCLLCVPPKQNILV